MAKFVLRSMTVLALLASAGTAAAAPFDWNNSSASWNTAGSWTPAGPPGTGDVARFLSLVNAPGTTVVDPFLDTLQAVNSLTFATNQNLGGWNLTTSAAPPQLIVGGTASTGITVYGPQTTTINGPQLAGASASFLINFNVANGSTLVLGGDTKVTAFQGNVNINNGIFRLDNSIVNATDRMLTTGVIKQQGGGTFELIGNSAGGTYNVGSYNVADNSVGGVNTISVISNSTTANTVLNFANTGSVLLRQGTRNATRFSSNGELGSANGPRITFVGTPLLSSGVFANSVSTPGFVIVSDSLGTNFATYSATAGVGVQSLSSPSQTSATVTVATTNIQLQAFTATGASGTNGQFNAGAANTVTATANIPGQTLRISPSGSDSVLAMGSNNLLPAAIMLDGAFDYAITGTGTLFGGTHYLYINNPATILSLQPTLTTSGNQVLIAGPGFLDLTGTVSQNAGGTARITIAGGVLRANETQIGLTSAGASQLNLTGGVLEIKNGTNGTGVLADFRRSLGIGTGTVNWYALGTGTSSAEQGSGGFSAFGAPASVNIGGLASPSTLQWGFNSGASTGNFVGDGFALKFGSTKSNAVLNWLNPINLETGTAYQLREINVTGGVGGDKTVLRDVISGATGVADLLKTGTGRLELTAANTYLGNTQISGGTFALAGTGSLTTPRITVGNTGRFAGNGTTTGSVFALSGGGIAPGNSTTEKTLSVGTNVNYLAGSYHQASLYGVGTATDMSVLVVAGNVVTPNNATLRLDLSAVSAGDVAALRTAGLPVVYTVVSSTNTITGNFAGIDAANSDFGNFSSSEFSLVGSPATNTLQVQFVPVPEPVTILGFGAAGLGLAGWIRRRVK